MKKWVVTLLVVFMVLLAVCAVSAFALYKFLQKATASRSAYVQVQEGQLRGEVEELMGGSGLPSEYTRNPPEGTDCRFWVDEELVSRAFEICFAHGRVMSKAEYDTGN